MPRSLSGFPRSFASEINHFCAISDRWFLAAQNPDQFAAPRYNNAGEYLLPPINLRAAGAVDLSTLDADVNDKAERTQQVLNVALGLGILTAKNTQRVLDFGAGYGGPTYVVSRMLANIAATGVRTSLQAVERNADVAAEIIDAGILPSDAVHVRDGIAFLNDPTTSEAFDLVTAFWAGPFFEGETARTFLRSSQRALAPAGRVLLTSDCGTTAFTKAECKSLGLPYESVSGTEIKGAPPTEEIIIIPKVAEFA